MASIRGSLSSDKSQISSFESEGKEIGDVTRRRRRRRNRNRELNDEWNMNSNKNQQMTGKGTDEIMEMNLQDGGNYLNAIWTEISENKRKYNRKSRNSSKKGRNGSCVTEWREKKNLID